MPEPVGKVKLSSETTIADYERMELAKDRAGIVRFLHKRLNERYIRPLKSIPSKERNGFQMMAICCLLIETLESFRQGWPDTNESLNRRMINDPCKPLDPRRNVVNAAEVAICYFFKHEKPFANLVPHSSAFYKSVRCGVLHQGETTGGWRILRKGPMFDSSGRTLNATLFLEAIEDALVAYRERLLTAPWNDEIWQKFRQKMRAIIDHCKS